MNESLNKFIKRWQDGQDVHVKIEGLDNEPQYDKQKLIDHFQENIDPLDLSINLIFDDQVNGDTNGGIKLNYLRYHKEGFLANTVPTKYYKWGPTLGEHKTIIPYTVMTATINLNFLDKYPIDNDNNHHAFLNNGLHELMHTLGVPHLHAIKKMDNPLMNPYLSTDKLYFTENDKRALIQLYGKHGRVFYFEPEQVGRRLYLIHKWKKRFSYSMQITDTIMNIDGLKKGNYKEIIE